MNRSTPNLFAAQSYSSFIPDPSSLFYYFLPYGNIRLTRSRSPSATRTSTSKYRFRLLVFLVRMWRACEWPRLILPVPVTRKRFAAPLCVFNFGIIAPFQISNPKLCGLGEQDQL